MGDHWPTTLDGPACGSFFLCGGLVDVSVMHRLLGDVYVGYCGYGGLLELCVNMESCNITRIFY